LINTGTQSSAAQQSYLTFTNSLLQVANASAPGCVVTNTLSSDTSTFDTVLQNEVCNSSSPCDLGGRVAPPGSIAFASGALVNPVATGDFRVARLAFCATGQGTARVHWQFSPPAPSTRDSEILDSAGAIVSNPGLYTDVTVDIVPDAVLVGHVTWQGRPAQPSVLQQLPITLTLKSGGTEVNYSVQNTDANGYFTVSVGTLPGGTYNWRVKGPKYLANAGSVTLPGAGETDFEIGLMFAGDANNDNIVTAIDFTILRASYGKIVGQPGYDDRADFTGDQVINVQDFVLIKTNFNHAGAPPLGFSRIGALLAMSWGRWSSR
jgi:hypothetical protein